MRVAVLGARGFIGSAVMRSLGSRGHSPIAVSAPRLTPGDLAAGLESLQPSDLERQHAPVIEELRSRWSGVDAVVNCAGNPDASSTDTTALRLANSLVPAIAAAACRVHGIPRFVQVSSAVVQGDRRQLDTSFDYRPFSAYAESKILGEQMVLRHLGTDAVIYRPPSVHDASRRISRALARVAASPLSSVASPGTAPTPQAHIDNVADAIAFLATTAQTPPTVVIHPWEGLTATSLLTLLSPTSRPPRHIPAGIARASLSVLRASLGRVGKTAPHVRRLQLLWLGQDQAPSWLTDAGWEPGDEAETWDRLHTELIARDPEVTR